MTMTNEDWLAVKKFRRTDETEHDEWTNGEGVTVTHHQGAWHAYFDEKEGHGECPTSALDDLHDTLSRAAATYTAIARAIVELTT